MAVPTAASAGHWSHNRRESAQVHRSHVSRPDHRQYHRGHSLAPRSHRHRHGVYRVDHFARRHHRADRHYCKPCRRHFDGRHGFDRHLRHRHHVPHWRLPFVMIHGAFGWVFYG
jgi:hypothetical protein